MDYSNGESGGGKWGKWLLIGGGVLIAIAAVVVLVLVLRSRANPAGAPSGGGPTPTTPTAAVQPQEAANSAAPQSGQPPKAKCGDSSCDRPQEDDKNCAADCLNAPLVIHSLSYEQSGADSLKVSWWTNAPANCTIEYGLTEQYEMTPLKEEGNIFDHVMTLTGLKSNRIFFRVSAKDVKGREFSIKSMAELVKP